MSNIHGLRHQHNPGNRLDELTSNADAKKFFMCIASAHIVIAISNSANCALPILNNLALLDKLSAVLYRKLAVIRLKRRSLDTYN